MKFPWIRASVLVLAGALAPSAAADEVEALRQRAAEQERQIRQLERELEQVRGEEPSRPAPRPAGPPLAPTASQPAAAAAAGPEGRYTVVAGDSLERIARRHGSTVAILAELNGIEDPSLIRIGQVLKLPAGAAASASTAGEEPAASTRARITVHEVVEGDTFFGIARRHGVTVEALRATNPELRPARLQVGDQVMIPTARQAVAIPREAPAVPVAPREPAATTPPPAPVEKPEERVRLVKIEERMSLRDFAARHGTTVERVNQLNEYSLRPETQLAVGSELYVPARP